MGEIVPELVAHTPNASGSWHELTEHLLAVGSLASGFAARFGGAAAAELAGRWHDLGKADPRFRQYLVDAAAGLRTGSPGIGHSAAGALHAHRAELAPVAFAVYGHHAGLRRPVDLEERLRGAEADPGSCEALERLAGAPGFVPPADPLVVLPAWLLPLRGREQRWAIELLSRMLLSVLVDADRLDTEAHCNPGRALLRGNGPGMAALVRRFNEGRAQATAARAGDPVSSARDGIRRRVVARMAAAAPGLFTFTSPTGSGKTLTVLEAALLHAERHGMDRVVIATPFISVTEQVAGVVTDLLDDGDGAVLEHHSGVAVPDDEDQPDRVVRSRLAVENWDAPVIVTTTVQLLESLFSDRPSACRKLHRLAGSVVVIDEAQSIPWRLLDPASRMLSHLVDQYGASVVMCTATQPPFDRLPALASRPVTELNDAEPSVAHPFARVKAEIVPGRPTWDDVAGAVLAAASDHDGQALVVLNTIADAERVFSSLHGADGAVFLSTRLCGAHRRDQLRRVRARLQAAEPVVLVSTQLIEAGIDVDFPVGLRAIGPVPSIAQVAGRVNRHGLRPTARLLVFDPVEGTLPPNEYLYGTNLARSLLADGLDPLADETVRTYFRHFLDGWRAKLNDLDIDGRREHLDFPEVAKRFRVIADEVVPVVVPYGSFDPAGLAPEDDGVATRRLLRSLQPFLVSLRRRAFDMAVKDGQAVPVQGLPVHRWLGGYDGMTGLVIADGGRTEVW